MLPAGIRRTIIRWIIRRLQRAWSSAHCGLLSEIYTALRTFDGSESREVSDVTIPAVQTGGPRSALVWDFMRLGFARRVASLGAFGVIYSTLMVLGLFLRESSQQLTIIWPAAGLLFMALWFSPRRNWI